MSTDMRERLIVALDVPTVAAADSMVWKLGDEAVFYKIGYQLAFAGGLPLARDLVRSGKRVFLDMKLHDIGNTVARAVEAIAAMGVDLVTIHAYPQTMRAAIEGRAGADVKIVAVTVLTSYDDTDLAEAGYAHRVKDLVARRAAQARDIGIDGLVASPEEAAAVRAILGPEGLVVTPGVRPAGSAAGDQKRIATPARAIAAGASHLVVGRPILEAADPAAAARAIVAEIGQAALAAHRGD